MTELGHKMYRVAEQGTLMEWINIEALVESVEILAVARESVRDMAMEILSTSVADNWETYRQYPLSAPLRTAAANTGAAVTLVGNAVSAYRDAFNELKALNRERISRIELVD